MKKIFVLVCVVSVLALSSCGLFKSEKQKFIDATVETTCLLFNSDNFFDPELEGQVKEIYKNYGFDVENETKMQELTTKYENDEEVQAAIMEALAECKTTENLPLTDTEITLPDEEVPPSTDVPASDTNQ